MTTDITPFTFPNTGQSVRTVTIDNEPWWIAADVATVLDLGNIRSSLALLEEDEKGVHTMDTLGGLQGVTIVNEPGLYSLILRSRKPQARAFKRWITHEVIPAIRRTGSYGTPPALPDVTTPAGVLAMAEQFAATARQLVAATERVAELEPAAQSWTALADATGDYSVADTAKILARGGIPTGRDRLFATLHGLNWTYRQGADGRYRAMQYAVDRGWLAELPKSHTHPRTGEPVLDPPQIRVTVKGLHELRLRLLPPMDIPPLFPAA